MKSKRKDTRTVSNDIHELGVSDVDPKNSYVLVFVPSITRDGEKLDHEYWRSETICTLSRLFGGATSIRGFGGWLDEERSGEIKEEEISVVVSFMREPDWNKENALQLLSFLKRMGREAEQGEIAYHVLGQLLGIRRFDDE